MAVFRWILFEKVLMTNQFFFVSYILVFTPHAENGFCYKMHYKLPHYPEKSIQHPDVIPESHRLLQPNESHLFFEPFPFA